MTFAESYLPLFDAEVSSTRKILERVPEEKLGWKPHEKSMTLGRLAGHVAEMLSWTVNTMQLDAYHADPATYKALTAENSAGLLSTFDGFSAEARQAIATASDEDFNKTWTLFLAGRQAFSMPRRMVLQSFLMHHLIHHRGQLSVYLRLLDIPVPGMYGPTADEM